MVRSEIYLWKPLLLLLSCVSMGKAGEECPKPGLETTLVLTDESTLKNEFPDGLELTVECSLGHEKESGSDIITCMNGIWSKPELICKKKDCGIPKMDDILKYDLTNGTLFRAQIKPFCTEGFEFRGSSYRHCLSTGWSGRAKCQAIECQYQPIPFAVKLDRKAYKYKEVVTIMCDPGYIIDGSENITCGEYGWSSSPSCVKVPDLIGVAEEDEEEKETSVNRTDTIITSTVRTSTVRTSTVRTSTMRTSTIGTSTSNDPPPGGMTNTFEGPYFPYADKIILLVVIFVIVVLVCALMYLGKFHLKRKGRSSYRCFLSESNNKLFMPH
ncbi:complement decay-accelerating factor isoform X2 [Hoplias malabaricus]|uniref:complement decay-accelerating factor isoform X2 n=1 Tax=Hoplias malabaricus TaxID=27720 RepID=UPI00346253CD